MATSDSRAVPAPAAAGVDVGGTFTDVVMVDTPGQRRHRAVKVPTTPGDQAQGVVAGLERAAGTHPPLIAHGSTAATNAVLERAVARTVLVTTDGFADVLAIARQDRPALYDLGPVRPPPLVDRSDVVTVHERTASDGRPVVALTDEEIDRVVDAVAARTPEAVAVSLLFAYAGPAHEERLCAALADRLGVPITRSTALLPEFREFERASTCVLNAAVAPVMHRYLTGLADRLPESRISVMTSGGGTAALDVVACDPVHTLLSGPAAGVVAAGAIAVSAGFSDAVAFDMGGTSTDVCLIRDGRPDVATEAEIGGLPFRTPAVAIHTVGAGGGSIAWVDRGGALRVGPRSAGAVPGPACYGLGGTEPTVTDAHCLLGHLDPEREMGGGLRLAAQAAREVMDGIESGPHGVLTVVQATMARALRRVTTERGVDPGSLALVAYGGAGPLHAAALARELGYAAVVVPPAPGVLSALGLLLAPPRHESSRTVMADARDDLASAWAGLEQEAEATLAAQGVSGPVTRSRLADCRYAGQSHELRVDGDGDLAEALHTAHHEAYGYAMPDEQVTVVTVRVVATATPVLPAPPTHWDQGPARPERRRRVGVGGEEMDARVLDRAMLSPGDTVTGPALV
ncbi:MAG: hydantoinase/oxoprolinase family protein, partial [Egibacteraceae bacterium]